MDASALAMSTERRQKMQRENDARMGYEDRYKGMKDSGLKRHLVKKSAPKIDYPALRRTLDGVLKDNARTKHVNFTFGAVTVTPGELSIIGDLILEHRIHIEVDKSKIMTYNPKTDTMRVNTLIYTDVKPRATIIHESTHAIYDRKAKGTSKIKTMDAEIAGFIAQGIYLRVNDPRFNKGQEVIVDETEVTGVTSGAFELAKGAIKIADIILAGKKFTDKDIKDLKDAIDNAYEGLHDEKEWTEFNGIK